MKVREVMTSDVSFCQPSSTLAEAAMMMWQRDCGVVPVVDEQKKVVGMITDRDICMAVATKNRLASDILAAEIISGKVKSCSPNDDVETALKAMKKKQLRRLPVTSKDGVLLGIVSLSDIAQTSKGKDLKKKLLKALREISAFRPPHLHEIASEDKETKDDDNDSDDSTEDVLASDDLDNSDEQNDVNDEKENNQQEIPVIAEVN